jgi:hypothetical protein
VNNRQNEMPVPESASAEEEKPMEMDQVDIEKALSQMEHTSEKVDPLEETMIDMGDEE